MSLRPHVSLRMNPKSCVVRLRKGDHDAPCLKRKAFRRDAARSGRCQRNFRRALPSRPKTKTARYGYGPARSFKPLPSFMQCGEISSPRPPGKSKPKVVATGERTSHWIMHRGEKTIEWDSELLADEPGKRIVWRSIGGESDNAGEVDLRSRAPAVEEPSSPCCRSFEWATSQPLGDDRRPKSEAGSHRESSPL